VDKQLHNGDFRISAHHQILLADEIKENELGAACSMQGRGEKRLPGFAVKHKGKTTWKIKA
jgi:hypothetical protein